MLTNTPLTNSDDNSVTFALAELQALEVARVDAARRASAEKQAALAAERESAMRARLAEQKAQDAAQLLAAQTESRMLADEARLALSALGARLAELERREATKPSAAVAIVERGPRTARWLGWIALALACASLGTTAGVGRDLSLRLLALRSELHAQHEPTRTPVEELLSAMPKPAPAPAAAPVGERANDSLPSRTTASQRPALSPRGITHHAGTAPPAKQARDSGVLDIVGCGDDPLCGLDREPPGALPRRSATGHNASRTKR